MQINGPPKKARPLHKRRFRPHSVTRDQINPMPKPPNGKVKPGPVLVALIRQSVSQVMYISIVEVGKGVGSLG